MTTGEVSAGQPLRVSDLVPLRRMLGTDSFVLRVQSDGSLERVQHMPAMFFHSSLRHALTNDVDRFDAACRLAVTDRSPVSFRPPGEGADVLINPILDDQGTDCRFLVCWARRTDGCGIARANLAWEDLHLDQVRVRYRQQCRDGKVMIEAAPWWATPKGEVLELWPHHSSVSAMGLGHAVMQALIIHAAEAATENSGGPAVRLEIPSADMLAGLVPVFHGALRASGLDPARVVVAIAVELAVDPDLLPVIVHLRTLGMKIDIVGLDALTSNLHTVSDTSTHRFTPSFPPAVQAGEWTDSFAEAARVFAGSRTA